MLVVHEVIILLYRDWLVSQMTHQATRDTQQTTHTYTGGP